MVKSRVKFLHKPNCTTCRKARGLLIGDRDHRAFLNTRNELYRKHKMGKNPPSRSEAIRMMALEPNLIRRPVVISGRKIVLGFDHAALEALAD